MSQPQPKEKMNNFRLRPPKDNSTIREISIEALSSLVRFRLDRDMICQPNDIFELIDGQWFLLRHGIKTLIEGRWNRIEF